MFPKCRREPNTQAQQIGPLASAIWNWAARQRDDLELPPNPATGIERNPERGKERFLSGDELARLGDALMKAETAGLPYEVDETKPKAKHAPKPEKRCRTLDPFAVAAIRMLLFTGARLREILHAKWDYVDFERGLLNLPTSKTGKKSVFLSAAALDVLAALPRLEGNDFIFPGEKDGMPRVDLKRPWGAVTQAAGLEGLRLHDLRHSFASIGAGGGLGLPIIGKLLGHRRQQMKTRPRRQSIRGLYRGIDLGLQEDTYSDEPRTRHGGQLVWELPRHRDVEGVPLTVAREITMSLHEKSTLRGWAESMLGHELTRAERANFAVKTLLGSGCLLEIVHVKTHRGRDFAKVANLMQAPDGAQAPEPVNPLVYFSLEPREFDMTAYDALTPWLQERIASSESWARLQKAIGGPGAQAALPSPNRRSPAEIIDDDIPF